MTTVYLIRHSERFSNSNIISWNTTQSPLLQSEKSILSVEGENRARKLSELDELNNLDYVYASNCVRTLETAKYILDKQNLKITLDERLDERRFGKDNSLEIPNWYTKQFLEEDYKTEGGESQREVRERMNEVISEIVNNHPDKRIAIFTHGYAIFFYLLKYCELVSVNENREVALKYKGEVFFDKAISAPEVFKLVFDKDNLEIELVEGLYES